MTDCPNATVRDLLPEYLHDRLPEHRRAEVRAHLDGCADCRAELALLAQIRDLTTAPPVDVRRIVNALPSYRRPSLWQRSWQSSQLRAAAVVLALVGGATLFLRSDEPSSLAGTGARPDTQIAAAGRAVATQATTAELPIGEAFADLSDGDLQALVDAIGKLDAVMASDPAEIVALPEGEGT